MSLSKTQQELQKRMLSPFKFGLFKATKLPLSFLVGIKIKELSEFSSTTIVNYKFLNSNPFKSMYFAVLSMSAELSTGALALLSVAKYTESIAVLVIESNGKFHKKAKGKIKFTCADGAKFKESLHRCVKNNVPATVIAESKGFNSNGELVCEYKFTWSFKVR